MTREYLVQHLIDSACFPVENVIVDDIGELWRNSITGDDCFIVFDEYFEVPTYCHIFHQLKVDPPLENGYDSDLAVYNSFKARIS